MSTPTDEFSHLWVLMLLLVLLCNANSVSVPAKLLCIWVTYYSESRDMRPLMGLSAPLGGNPKVWALPMNNDTGDTPQKL